MRSTTSAWRRPSARTDARSRALRAWTPSSAATRWPPCWAWAARRRGTCWRRLRVRVLSALDAERRCDEVAAMLGMGRAEARHLLAAAQG